MIWRRAPVGTSAVDHGAGSMLRSMVDVAKAFAGLAVFAIFLACVLQIGF